MRRTMYVRHQRQREKELAELQRARAQGETISNALAE